MPEELFTNISGIKYGWVGGFGCLFRSREYGVGVGDTRVIDNILFYASSSISKGFLFRREIGWTVQWPLHYETVDEIKNKLFTPKYV